MLYPMQKVVKNFSLREGFIGVLSQVKKSCMIMLSEIIYILEIIYIISDAMDLCKIHARNLR